MATPKAAFDFTTASLDARITLTRADATATRVNSSGFIATVAANQPRFDYNPVTLACKGLLIEETRINQLLYSEDIGQASWGKFGLDTTGSYLNVATAPDNASTADKLIEDTSTGLHRALQDVTISPNALFTTTVYAKADTRTILTVILTEPTGGSGAYARYNLSNGTMFTAATAQVSGISAAASIAAAGNGWYRCTLTVNPNVAGTIVRTQLTLNNGTTDSYLGNGSGLFVRGMQLESGAYATSYIPTGAPAITRNADVAVATSTNFSSWWQTGSGGADVAVLPSTVVGTRPAVQFDDNTANNIIALRGNTTNPELYIRATTDQAQIDAGTIAAGTEYQLFGVWQTNDCAVKVNNGTKVPDATATIPTVTQMRLGSDGTNYLNGHLVSIDYYTGDQIAGIGRYTYTRRKNKVVAPAIF